MEPYSRLRAHVEDFLSETLDELEVEEAGGEVQFSMTRTSLLRHLADAVMNLFYELGEEEDALQTRGDDEYD